MDYESNESIFYFAYGSNADPERFKARVGPWRSRSRARLQDYRLRFARMVQSEGGGGAVVDESPGAHVDGVLFEITSKQLMSMDKEEFDPSRDVETTGKRIRETVETAEGRIESELYTVEGDGGERLAGRSVEGKTHCGFRKKLCRVDQVVGLCRLT